MQILWMQRCVIHSASRSVERSARVLEKINPDIVALQEVVNHEGLSIEDHQASFLAERLGHSFAIGKTREHHGGIYGNVTLSRWRFELVRQVDLPVSGREERGVLRTDIRIGQHLVRVFNVHLGTAHHERRRQAVRLMDVELHRSVDISGPRITKLLTCAPAGRPVSSRFSWSCHSYSRLPTNGRHNKPRSRSFLERFFVRPSI
jgi:endonuclease/exonuclease/phosphatase family metal-dependent hydrolase